MKMIKLTAYFEPGSNGSPAQLPIADAIREFESETIDLQKYGEKLFPPAKITLYFRDGRKQFQTQVIGSKETKFCKFCRLPILNEYDFCCPYCGQAII